MSDLYHETSEAGAAEDGASGSGHGTSTIRQYETAGPESGQGYESLAEAGSYGEYYETEGATEARIAAQDPLPSPAESRAATWGNDAEYYDETQLAAEYDGDINALLAEEERLPTPQESRARTWGDSPDFYNETDPASEYEGDLGALTPTDHHPYVGQASPGTRDHPASDQHAQAGTYGEDAPQEPVSPELPEVDRDANTRGANGPDNVDAAEQPVAGTGKAAIEPGLQPSAEEHERSAAAQPVPEKHRDAATAGVEIPGESSIEAADSSEANQKPGAERSPAYSDRIAKLEARIERLEQAGHEQVAEPIRSKELDAGDNVHEKEAKEHGWRWPSDTRVNLGAAVVGSGLAEAADFVAAAPAHHAIGIIGAVVSVGVAAVLDVRDKRKDKHVRGPEN